MALHAGPVRTCKSILEIGTTYFLTVTRDRRRRGRRNGLIGRTSMLIEQAGQFIRRSAVR